MMPIGIPEVLILFVVAAFWAIPIAGGVWALITLHRLRVGQEELRRRLLAIEQGLYGRVSG